MNFSSSLWEHVPLQTRSHCQMASKQAVDSTSTPFAYAACLLAPLHCSLKHSCLLSPALPFFPALPSFLSPLLVSHHPSSVSCSSDSPHTWCFFLPAFHLLTGDTAASPAAGQLQASSCCSLPGSCGAAGQLPPRHRHSDSCRLLLPQHPHAGAVSSPCVSWGKPSDVVACHAPACVLLCTTGSPFS